MIQQKTATTDYATALLVETQRQILEELRAIRRKGEPMTGQEMRETFSPEDWAEAKRLRVKHESLDDIMAFDAHHKGYPSVEAMMRAEKKKPQGVLDFIARRHTETKPSAQEMARGKKEKRDDANEV